MSGAGQLAGDARREDRGQKVTGLQKQERLGSWGAAVSRSLVLWVSHVLIRVIPEAQEIKFAVTFSNLISKSFLIHRVMASNRDIPLKAIKRHF